MSYSITDQFRRRHLCQPIRVFDCMSRQSWVNILFLIVVYDSSAKIPSGILNGNINQFGDFDQCLKVNDENSGIQGQYCLTYVEMTLPSNSNEKLKYIIDLMHSHSAFRSRLEDVSIHYYKYCVYVLMYYVYRKWETLEICFMCCVL